MIDINTDTDSDILAIKASEKLSEEDLDTLKPVLQKYNTDSDDPHLIMILENFRGWKDAAAFWKDLKLDTEYIGFFDRIAVVGEKKWQSWGIQLLNPLTKEELRFFPIDRAEAAWSWVEEDH